MTKARIPVVLVTVAAAVVVAAVTAGIMAPNASSTRALCAEFADGVGLYPGNKVQLLGIEVGAVTAVTNKPDHVQVDFTVPADLDLPVDVGVVTFSQSIVSDRHVELTKPYAGGPKFTGSQCITVQATKTPIGVSETFGAVDKLANAILGTEPGQQPSNSSGAQAINDSLQAVSRALDGTGGDLNQTLRGLAAIIGDPNRANADIQQLVANAENLTSTALRHWDIVVAAVQPLPGSLKMIEGLADGFGAALAHLAHVLPILVETLNRFGPRAYHSGTNQLVPWLRDILNAYTPNIVGAINALPPVADWLAATYQPSWGSRNIGYQPVRAALSPAQAGAVCAELRQQHTPGSEQVCAPGSDSDPVTLGLTDLLLGSGLS